MRDTIKYFKEEYGIILNAFIYEYGRSTRKWLALRKSEDEIVYIWDEKSSDTEIILKSDSVELTPKTYIEVMNCFDTLFIHEPDNVKRVSKYNITKEGSRLTDMIRRCYKEDYKDYKYYGACGVKIDKEWLDDSFKFYCFAICNNSIGNTIDRINPKGDYEPRNVRFIDWKTNVVENKINVSQYPPKPRYFKGIGRIYQQEYEIKFLKMVRGIVRTRIRSNGWTLFEALNIPKGITQKTFWQNVEAGDIVPLWEVFLTDEDQKAVYFDKIGDVIECPYCKAKAMTLTPDYKVSCRCGVEVKLKSI